MRRVGSTAIALVLVAAACTSAAGPEPPGTLVTATTTFTITGDEGAITVSRPVGCTADPGSPTDLSSEPGEWLAFGTYMRWYDGECPVRVDVISHINGAEHCGWERAEFLTMATTLGEPVTTMSEQTTNRYVWNAGGVIPQLESGSTIPVDELPATATETGYSQGNSELWIDTATPSVVYVVDGSDARVFVRDLEGGLCA